MSQADCSTSSQLLPRVDEAEQSRLPGAFPPWQPCFTPLSLHSHSQPSRISPAPAPHSPSKEWGRAAPASPAGREGPSGGHFALLSFLFSFLFASLLPYPASGAPQGTRPQRQLRRRRRRRPQQPRGRRRHRRPHGGPGRSRGKGKGRGRRRAGLGSALLRGARRWCLRGYSVRSGWGSWGVLVWGRGGAGEDLLVSAGT